MHYHFTFRLRGRRYRGAIPEARTKWQAEQAERRIRQDAFDERFGKINLGISKFCDFIDTVYMPWAKTNKRSWKDDDYKVPVLRSYFQGKSFCDMSSLDIERFKSLRLATPTKYGGPRSATTVNLELALLSRICSLAVKLQAAETNPCFKVSKLKLDNERYRYLLPEEEPRLKSALTGPRAHLLDLVSVALGTGLRKNEQLSLRVEHIDFARNLIVVTQTKTRRNREVPMNHEVREILNRLCRFKPAGKYVFVNPTTGTRLTDIKKAFRTACELAGIRGLVWHDLRATFATRLGEAGYEAFTIASLLGHANIRTTQRYVRATERNKRAAVQAAMLGHNLATTLNGSVGSHALA